MASPSRHIGTCTTAEHRQPLAGGGLEAVITGVAHQACSFHADWVRDCAAGSTGARSRNLRTRRAGGQYTPPSRIFRVQPPLISQVVKDVLGFDGYSRLSTADARRIAAVLEREGWERGKPAATRSPPGPLGASAAAAGSNQLQVEAPGDGGSPSRSPVQWQDIAALAPRL